MSRFIWLCSCGLIVFQQGRIAVARSPVADLKAIKNETEVEGFRASHIRDGAALARYFAWLEERLNAGDELTESQAADQLEKYRSELDLFRGLSFTTISSTGPNGGTRSIYYPLGHNSHCAIQLSFTIHPIRRTVQSSGRIRYTFAIRVDNSSMAQRTSHEHGSVRHFLILVWERLIYLV